jgi:hypothetical protein
MSSSPGGLFNIFDSRVKIGNEESKRTPGKRYLYVEHPTEGWKVFLRAVCFLHRDDVPFDATHFLVVRTTGSKNTSVSWEPPKGQMEGKDLIKDVSLIESMATNVTREVEEEAKIKHIHNLRYTGLVVQNREDDYPENTYFQYHIFQAFVSPVELESAHSLFDFYKKNPSEFKKLRKDQQEKDAIGWFHPKRTKLFGRWSPSIVALYLQYNIQPSTLK